MAKEESRKEKKSNSKAGKGSAAAAAVPDERRAAVVTAVAAFLESSSYPRTLATLQSEASLEADSWRSSPVSLEELVSKFLDSSNSTPGAGIAKSIEQEKTAGGVAEDASKKKKKKGSDTEVSKGESKASEPSAVQKPGENADVEIKEEKHKKKKSKKQENDEDVKARLEKAESAIINKFETTDTLKEDSNNGFVDGAPVEKGKKKKGKSAPETSDKVDTGTTAAGADGAKGKNNAAETGKEDNEKKSKKKLKKSKENVEVVENKEVARKDSVLKSNDENNSGMEIDNGEHGMPPSDNGVVGKKRKLEEVEGSNPPAKEYNTANQKISNSSEDDTKPNKRQKKSSEPKTVNAFQRVKLEDIKFADERLQDNSYWAKGGADSGYGAKAQEVLGQVRGRGFRHEKTKKKRGTYRGGQIDLQTHSIKFNDSDD